MNPGILPGQLLALRRLGLALRAVLLAAVICCAIETSAQASIDDTPVGQAVKAAYLYKFLGYVNWPPQAFAGPTEPYVIGVAADAAMIAALSDVASHHQVRNRRIVVRRVNPGDGLDGLHVLYIARPQANSVLLRKARARPILTVVDDTDDDQDAVVIRFRLVDDRIRFDISLDAARTHQLQLSSRLLAVAHRVEGGPR